MPKPPPFRRPSIEVGRRERREWVHSTAMKVHERIQAGQEVTLAMLGEVRDSRRVEHDGKAQVMLLCGENGWQAYAPTTQLRAYVLAEE